MPDRTDLQANATGLARALWTLSNLILALRVTCDDVWHSHKLINEAVVRIDVTGYPAERDELLAAMPACTPEHWQGNTGTEYREWRGVLLTMNMTVVETLPGPAATAEPEPAPAVDEPGQSTTDLAARYAGVPGVVVVPGPGGDDELSEVWARYARARCMHEFEGRTFPTAAEAETAINLWAGRDMLEHTDVTECAAALVDPTLTPEREPAWRAPHPRGRLLRLLTGGTAAL